MDLMYIKCLNHKPDEAMLHMLPALLLAAADGSLAQKSLNHGTLSWRWSDNMGERDVVLIRFRV